MVASFAVANTPPAPARASASARRQACSKRGPPAVRAYKSSEEQTADAAPAAAAAAPEGQQLPAAITSYDERDYGFEAAMAPQMPSGELSESEDEEEMLQQQRSAEYMEQLRAMGGDSMVEEEIKKAKISCMEVLESVDGMVGNYEVPELQEKREELQSAADDYQRILAELQQLEKAAAAGAAGGTAAGGGATASAEVGEGAGVEDVE